MERNSKDNGKPKPPSLRVAKRDNNTSQQQFGARRQARRRQTEVCGSARLSGTAVRSTRTIESPRLLRSHRCPTNQILTNINASSMVLVPHRFNSDGARAGMLVPEALSNSSGWDSTRSDCFVTFSFTSAVSLGEVGVCCSYFPHSLLPECFCSLHAGHKSLSRGGQKERFQNAGRLEM